MNDKNEARSSHEEIRTALTEMGRRDRIILSLLSVGWDQNGIAAHIKLKVSSMPMQFTRIRNNLRRWGINHETTSGLSDWARQNKSAIEAALRPYNPPPPPQPRPDPPAAF